MTWGPLWPEETDQLFDEHTHIGAFLVIKMFKSEDLNVETDGTFSLTVIFVFIRVSFVYVVGLSDFI